MRFSPYYSGRRNFCALLGLIFGIIASDANAKNQASLRPPSSAPVSAAQIYAIPMHFQKNAGQVDEQVKFLSRGPGYTLFLSPTEALLSLSGQDSAGGSNLRMTLINGNPETKLQGVDQLEGTFNYLIGNQSANWRVGVPSFGKVKYEEVYSGIDLVYYGNQRQVEYDFV